MDSSPFLMDHAYIRSSMACLIASVERPPKPSRKEGSPYFGAVLYSFKLYTRMLASRAATARDFSIDLVWTVRIMCMPASSPENETCGA